MSSHGPVDPSLVAKMHAIMRSIDTLCNPGSEPKTIGVTVLMFPFNETGRISYMSNASRKEMIISMKELIANWEGRVVENDNEH